MRNAGVNEEEIVQQIIQSAGGLPYFFDLAVDTYLLFKEKGKEIKVDWFKGNYLRLTERFLKYMNNTEKELLYLLTCMRNWNDTEIETICKDSDMVISIDLLTYNNIKNFSFVLCNEDGNDSSYYLHDTMLKVINYQCPQYIRKYYLSYLIKGITRKKEENNYTKAYTKILSVIRNLAFLDDNQFIVDNIEIVFDVMYSFIEKYEFSKYMNIYNLISAEFKNRGIIFFNKKLLLIRAKYLMRCGNYCEATKKYRKILTNFEIGFEERIKCYEDISYCYAKGNGDSDYKKAISFAKKAVKMRKSNNDCYERNLPVAYNSLAYAYFCIRDYKKALVLYWKSKRIREKYLGRFHYRTLANINNMAEVYIMLGKYRIAKRLLMKSVKHLQEQEGEDFVYTLVCKSNLVRCLIAQRDDKVTIDQIEELFNKLRVVLSENSEYCILLIELKGDYYNMKQEYDRAKYFYKIAYKQYKINGNNMRKMNLYQKMKKIGL